MENDVSMSVHSIAENSINTVQIITKYMHDILSKKQDDPTLSSNTRCVKELTSIDEIYRPTDVLCIGDIHGNIEILEKNLESIGAINSSGEWM